MICPRLPRHTAFILVTASLYCITGKLGLLLAIPPGYATAVWLPSGIALGAVLMWGNWAAPGVWLGSFVVNLSLTLPAEHSPKSVLVAAGIGLGAALQAGAGAFLIRRTVGFPTALVEWRDILRFLALGGGAASLINASLSVSLLVGTGVVSPHLAPLNWFTWWVGDAIGVCVVLPLMLIAIGRPRDVWRQRFWPVGLPLVLFMGVAAAVFLWVERAGQPHSPFWQVWLLLVSGFSLISLLGALLLVLTGRTRVVEEQVAQRTASLEEINRAFRQLNASLEERIAQRTAQLEEARKEAERANAAKGAFLAAMSHEIRTPMNGVLGMAQVLAHTPLDDDQRRYLAILRDSGESLLTVINDILDFSKIEAGAVALEEVGFSLHGMLGQSLHPFAPQAQAKGLALELDVSAGLPDWRRGDPARLRQVVTNLVGNALKFTQAGWVRVAVLPGAGAQEVRVEVADTGEGIAREAQDRLFKPFSQADASITRRHGGTGLGLAISARLIGQMGGRMGVDSRPGHGSTFWFEVPLPPAAREEAPAVPAGTPLALPAPPPGKRVLLVEDSQVNQMVARTMLESAGHRVTLVHDGAQAMARLEAPGLFDVILMDCQMPVMDGLEATRRLRLRERERGWRPHRVVAMTANAMPGSREKCLAAGMDDYLAKPVHMEELLRRVAE